MKYAVRLDEAEAYVPLHHTGTLNRRLVDGKIGAKNFQLIYGEIEPRGMAQAHSHDGVEQGGLVLEGKALLEIGEERLELEANSAFFIPPNTEHQITNIGAIVLKLIIVYAPQL